jgi:hypothetical protein
MVRRVVSLVVACAVAGSVLGAPSVSFAEDKKVEATAKALQKKAMGDDYLATEFGKAKDKLDKAIAQCGTDKCTANLRALLRRDLGTVLIVGGLDKDKGTQAFAEAAKLDNSIQLDADYKTKDTEAAWEKAKKSAGKPEAGGSGKPETGGKSGGGEKTGASDGNPEGDFAHTPVAEQAVRTPVPIYAEYNGTDKLVRVVARYKGLGMTEWKRLELKKMGDNGWGGLVPCLDVQVGKMQYYLQGLNEEKEEVASAGGPKDPYVMQITQTIAGEAPHLPGQEAPKQCADTGDCPPDFPGCKTTGGKMVSAEELLKDGDDVCEADTDCKSKVCKAGKCTFPEGAVDAKNAYPRIWVGGQLSYDIAFIPSATNVCNLITAKDDPRGPQATPVNDSNYYCVDGDVDYPSKNAAGEQENLSIPLNQEKSNRIESGTAGGNFRILLSLDYALSKNFLVGGRVGLSLLGYPGQGAGVDGNRFGAAPLHLEARGTFVVGKDALAKAGLAPYVYLAGGIAAYEVKQGVKVNRATPDIAKTPLPQKAVDAWKVGGPGFIALGGGARYAVNPKFALFGGLRGTLAVGYGVLPVLTPEVGAQVGF